MLGIVLGLIIQCKPESKLLMIYLGAGGYFASESRMNQNITSLCSNLRPMPCILMLKRRGTGPWLPKLRIPLKKIYGTQSRLWSGAIAFLGMRTINYWSPTRIPIFQMEALDAPHGIHTVTSTISASPQITGQSFLLWIQTR